MKSLDVDTTMVIDDGYGDHLDHYPLHLRVWVPEGECLSV